jgi:catechol 2,3-dioxygenase-like lactoylglutathione lyase family enzyme
MFMLRSITGVGVLSQAPQYQERRDMEQRLTAITLGVADITRSKAFYSRLGWMPAFENEHVAFYQVGGLVLCLFTGLAEDADVEPRSAGLSSIAHNVRTPEAVDAALSEAQAAGAIITKPAHDAFWGGRTGYFADPDGHLWEVAWNPHWPMDEEGRVQLASSSSSDAD